MKEKEGDNIFFKEKVVEVVESLQKIRKCIKLKIDIELSEQQIERIVSVASYFILKYCMKNHLKCADMEDLVNELFLLSNDLLGSIKNIPSVMKIDLKNELINIDFIESYVSDFNKVISDFNIKDHSNFRHVLEDRDDLAKYIRLILESGYDKNENENENETEIRNSFDCIFHECMRHAMMFASEYNVKIINEVVKEELPEWSSDCWQQVNDEKLDIINESIRKLAFA